MLHLVTLLYHNNSKNKIIPSKKNQKTIDVNTLILANILNCLTDYDEWYLSKY